MLLNRKIVKRW